MKETLHNANRMAKRTMWLGLLILIWPMAVIINWSMDRKPPFELVSFEPVVIRQGQPLKLNAKVKRDMDRRCSVLYSRYTLDAYDRRANESPTAYMNNAAMQDMVEKMGPDKLIITYPLPAELAVGPGVYVTVMDWQCNPLHAYWPIEMIMKIPFTVIPKDAPLPKVSDTQEGYSTPPASSGPTR